MVLMIMARWEQNVAPDILEDNNLLACIECGRCTAICPAALPTPLRARNVIRAVLKGDMSVIEDNDDLWHCTTCFDCQERCPKGVRVTEAILNLRSWASGIGLWPEPHRLAVESIGDTGNTFPLEDDIRKLRGQLSLPLDPPDCAHDDEELSAYQRLLEITNFKGLTPRLKNYPLKEGWDRDDGGEDV
jgi:heterodisulfide reductase subunit C